MDYFILSLVLNVGQFILLGIIAISCIVQSVFLYKLWKRGE